MKPIIRSLDRITDVLGYLVASLTVLMVAVVFYNVIMRYLFSVGSVAMQELEWHFFSAAFMLGMSYTLKYDAHVRVDIFYNEMSIKRRALINVFGAFLFIFPVAIVIVLAGFNFFHESYSIGERSGDPGGLPYVWIIKSVIMISFVLLLISALSFLLRNLEILFDPGDVQ